MKDNMIPPEESCFHLSQSENGDEITYWCKRPRIPVVISSCKKDCPQYEAKMKDNIDKDNIDIVVEALKEIPIVLAGAEEKDYERAATSILKALPRLDRDNVEKILRKVSKDAIVGNIQWDSNWVDKILSLTPTDTQLKKENEELKAVNKALKTSIDIMEHNIKEIYRCFGMKYKGNGKDKFKKDEWEIVGKLSGKQFHFESRDQIGNRMDYVTTRISREFKDYDIAIRRRK